ncbi:MAG: RNA methyltransferase [FCB group bacterium]|nr:RNA methyltransferase [FCB group bacterium]
MAKIFNLFLSCAGGLEEVCCRELERLKITDCRPAIGGVHFTGTLKTMYRINLHSRIGIRLLVKIAKYHCSSEDELYHKALEVPWNLYLTTNMTFAVHSFVSNSKIRHSKYAALKLKDGLVDAMRRKFGQRPNVDVEHPDVQFNLHLNNNIATLYLDSSGRPLSRRGYRTVLHKASLNEALAAGILYLAKWDGKSALYDPLCGSGTFPIEAAMMAADQAPGLLRNRFGFMGWKNYNRELWDSLRTEAQQRIDHSKIPSIYGSDGRGDNITLAERNSKAAGLSGVINWSVADISEFRPAGNAGLIVCNPPYGERLGNPDQLKNLYRILGDVFKQHCSGHSAYIFTGNPELGKAVGLRTSAKIPLRNGNIDCRLLKYDLYEGTRKKFPAPEKSGDST